MYSNISINCSTYFVREKFKILHSEIISELTIERYYKLFGLQTKLGVHLACG